MKPPLATAAVRVLALVVIAAAAAGVLPASASGAEAAAKVICWKRLLNDWFDGRIDQAYPVRCYREAIANLPEDVDVYSTARDDINRALLAAIRSSTKKTGARPTEATPVKPPERRASVPAKNGSDRAPGFQGRDADGSGPIGDVLATGSPSNADSVPLPLIVLAALALLLLAAAAAGLVSRRLQARRAPPAEEPPPVP
jgi:hypothetical protein